MHTAGSVLRLGRYLSGVHLPLGPEPVPSEALVMVHSFIDFYAQLLVRRFDSPKRVGQDFYYVSSWSFIIHWTGNNSGEVSFDVLDFPTGRLPRSVVENCLHLMVSEIHEVAAFRPGPVKMKSTMVTIHGPGP